MYSDKTFDSQNIDLSSEFSQKIEPCKQIQVIHFTNKKIQISYSLN